MATKLKGCGRGVFGLASWEKQVVPPALAERIRKPPSKVPKPGQGIVAKYTYKANPNSPMGLELNLKAGDKLKFIESPTSNPHWWLSQSEGGEEGYVPASYMHIMEVTQLPWLEGREPDQVDDIDPNHKPVFKPYQATYDLKGVAKGTDKFHCEICEKFFNGPQPYNMHMNSKAHKEEVEIREAYANM